MTFKNHITKGERFLERHSVQFTPGYNEKDRMTSVDYLVIVLIFLFIGTMVYVCVDRHIKVTQTNTSVAMLSDHDQEREYCQQAMTGKEVRGANLIQLAEHCRKFL